MAKKVEKSDNQKYAEDWIPIKDIQNGLILVEGKVTEGGDQYITGVRIEPRNIFISTQEIQDRTIYSLRNFYNTMDYEFWLVCCDRPVDINLYRSELEIMYNNSPNPQLRKLILQDINKCEQFIGPQYNAVDTEFYLLFKDSVKETERIQKRVHNMITGLANAGLNSRQLTEDDIRVLLDSYFNDSKRTEYGTVMSDV